jgi:DNA-binding IclR family transcriptional regulator
VADPETRVPRSPDGQGGVQVITLERYTENTVTNREELLDVLATVCKTGIAYNREEATHGIWWNWR